MSNETTYTPNRTNTPLEQIAHLCDGPLTPFVAMKRACELAASGRFTPEECADALSDVLESLDGATVYPGT